MSTGQGLFKLPFLSISGPLFSFNKAQSQVVNYSGVHNDGGKEVRRFITRKHERERFASRHLTASVTQQARSSTFSCGGSLPIKPDAKFADFQLSKPVSIWFDTNGSVSKVILPANPEGDNGIQDLVTACTPAYFGRGGEDVLDETYRKAGKLDTDHFLTTFCPYTAGIVDVVSQLLLPNAVKGEPRSVKAELYKLNVYSGPNGKFKAHVDTPRDASQIGSLVIALPSSFTGGELVVRNGGKEVVFDWSSEADDAAPAINWAAFYSDCEHEIFEVKSGSRITLTYNLYAMTPAAGVLAGNIDGLLDPTQLPLYNSLERAMDAPGFLQNGRVLAVYLTHSYAHTHKELNFLPNSLKGSDMALYEVARSLELKCIVRPLITLEGVYESRKGDEVDYTLRGKGFPSLTERNEEYDDAIRPEALDDYKLLNARQVTWLNRPKFEELAVVRLAYGDEAELGYNYSAAALLIRIPPLKERLAGTAPPQFLTEGIAADPGDTSSEEESEDSPPQTQNDTAPFLW